jgi:transposase
MPKRYRYSKIFRAIYSFLGFVYNEIIHKEDVIFIFLKRTHKKGKCPSCGRRNRLSKEFYKRTVRDLGVGPKDCYITFFENKLRCKCGFRGFEELDFVRPYSRCTKRFEEFVFLLCQKMALTDVCKVMKIDWKTAREIDQYYTMRNLESLDNIYPKRIGIDEIAYQKGHKYLTIIRDLDLNKVIWVGLDRKEQTLDMFFEELGLEKQKHILLAVVDMWDPYIASLTNYCPNVRIVYDKFHIIKIINQALDDVRKKEFAKTDNKQRKEWKKKRFLILKRNKNLNDKQKETLNELMNQNETLYQAYLLKEQISDIMDEPEVSTAITRLEEWLKNVINVGIDPITKAAKVLFRHLDGILYYLEYRVTNAGSEGFNNKINIIKRRAYGYKDIGYFILKIYQSCGVMKS